MTKETNKVVGGEYGRILIVNSILRSPYVYFYSVETGQAITTQHKKKHKKLDEISLDKGNFGDDAMGKYQIVTRKYKISLVINSKY